MIIFNEYYLMSVGLEICDQGPIVHTINTYSRAYLFCVS